MLAVDVAAIWLVSRHKSLIVWCGAMALAGAVALGLGRWLAGCDENDFGIFRLWAYGVFLHGVGLLAATAVLWRRRRPILAGAMVAGAMALLLVAADAFLIEPHWLEVSHWQIASPKIHHPMRIVVVADLQTDDFGPYERGVLRQALAEKPDLLLLAGDYIQTPEEKYPLLKREINDFLREIHFTAPLGAFAIRGNVDDAFDWPDIFRGSGVTPIFDRKSFDLGDLRLTGLPLWESADTQLELPPTRPDRFHLVLGHVPNFAMSEVQADLLVAAHTHGGQVRFPFLGPVITHCRVSRAWAAGLTELPGGRRLLVSRGVGMERSSAPPMRFLCRPELMVIDLVGE
jgi:predicted MPP superfamily phosphohydrolase